MKQDSKRSTRRSRRALQRYARLGSKRPPSSRLWTTISGWAGRTAARHPVYLSEVVLFLFPLLVLFDALLRSLPLESPYAVAVLVSLLSMLGVAVPICVLLVQATEDKTAGEVAADACLRQLLDVLLRRPLAPLDDLEELAVDGMVRAESIDRVAARYVFESLGAPHLDELLHAVARVAAGDVEAVNGRELDALLCYYQDNGSIVREALLRRAAAHAAWETSGKGDFDYRTSDLSASDRCPGSGETTSPTIASPEPSA
ncbi:MAG: hypothetical protein OXU20_07005 [Myxococcales bacterium]|nr:hypothetical protein [Myxococcales bacterium]MDD9965631.1 hypothetical protein [Myxococcales bacterium]